MWLGFVIAAPRVFTDLDIYRAFAETTPQFGIVALSLTFVVITGEIDLSFPSVMALGTAAFCLVTAYAGAPWWVGLICALATGAVCGLVNGLLVAALNIPSLVITIGTQFLFRGLELVLMGGTGVPLTADQYPEMHALLRETYFGVPVQTLWMVAILIAEWILLNRTQFGAHVFLVGDNPISARLMGVNVARVKIKAFVLVGRDGGVLRALELDLRLLLLAEHWARGRSSTRSPRCFSAARRCSAARDRWSARSSHPSSSARSTPASCRPASTRSTPSSPSAW